MFNGAIVQQRVVPAELYESPHNAFGGDNRMRVMAMNGATCKMEVRDRRHGAGAGEVTSRQPAADRAVHKAGGVWLKPMPGARKISRGARVAQLIHLVDRARTRASICCH